MGKKKNIGIALIFLLIGAAVIYGIVSSQSNGSLSIFDGSSSGDCTQTKLVDQSGNTITTMNAAKSYAQQVSGQTISDADAQKIFTVKSDGVYYSVCSMN